MAGTITTKIGDGLTNQFGLLAVINGTGVVPYGDAADAAGSNSNVTSAVATFNWGWNTNDHRATPVWNFSLTGLLPRKIQVARAYVRFFPTGKNVPVGYVYPGWDLSLYEIENAPGSGITWRLRDTATPWVGDYGPMAGFDFDATPVGTTQVPAAVFAALSTGGATPDPDTYVDVDVTAAVQRALDEKRPLRLVAPVPFAWPGDTCMMLFRNPLTSSSGVRTHLVVEYWPAIGTLSPSTSESGRPADFSKLHNPNAAGTSNRTWLDAIEQGTTGATVKEWSWNFRKAGPRRHVILGTSRAECDPVDNTGSVSTETLRYIYAYDRDDTASPDTYAPEGRLVVEVQSGGATYKLSFTPPGGAATYLLEETTGLSTVDMAADHIFEYASKRAFKIFTRDWSATTGFNVADRFTTNCRADARTTQSTSTLGLVEVMPPTPDRFGDAGDTAKARKISGAYTQQMWAAAADVNISGTTHTHVEVRNTSETNWLTGSPVTLISEDGTIVVETTIETVYSSTHGTYPQQIRLSTQLSAPQLAAMTDRATITGGIYLGTFAANLVRNLAAATTVGANSITLDTAFEATPGQVQIVDTILGYSQVIDITSGTTVLALSEMTEFAFSAGSTVFAIIDSGSNPAAMAGAPFFVQGDIPDAQAEGAYSGFYRYFERRLV